jgi:hypothetical protein
VPQNVLACDREQELLLPPSLREWLPEEHLAWFVLDAVEEIDLSAFYGAYRKDGWGRAAFEPQMMVALLLYAYAVGERSSRGIERRCREDVAFQPAQTLACRPRRGGDGVPEAAGAGRLTRPAAPPPPSCDDRRGKVRPEQWKSPAPRLCATASNRGFLFQAYLRNLQHALGMELIMELPGPEWATRPRASVSGAGTIACQ